MNTGTIQDIIFRYWGKAGSNEDGGFHLLVWHALDVSAVGRHWLQASQVIRDRFTCMTEVDPEQAIAWALFFIALHDLGKFDIRFQIKVEWLWRKLNGDSASPLLSASLGHHYWHGEYAAYWLFHDFDSRFQWKPDDFLGEAEGEARWAAWQPWLRAVAGHHGMEPREAVEPEGSPPMAPPELLAKDREARLAFITAMERLFLVPAGLSLDDIPPSCDLEFVAGFCAVCDWLGSTTENSEGEPRFSYDATASDIEHYFQARVATAETVLKESGLLTRNVTEGGMTALFPQFTRPHQVQTLVDDLTVSPSLTLIEAPTGSGKTEAALAYAARLLAAGEAESIIFALPTQATADAMLERIVAVTDRLFEQGDIVLAHGKSRFNPRFTDLQRAARRGKGLDVREKEASAQCALWLAQSRKRVFLGQIGVCTVDQVLVSALPVRHRFVRGFGLGKSVLIIDEVHAYDAYMYGLLDRVLRRQKAMGGSAVLLSATLPLTLRRALVESWEGDADALHEENPYPLITQVTEDGTKLLELPEEEKQRLAEKKPREVHLEYAETADMLPDEVLEQAIVDAAQTGANVTVICNLVADAQCLFERLCSRTDKPVLLFHSRFRFKDRQRIQQRVMEAWGKEGHRPDGAILVATQVVEQSLDIDFDWMITQLCPVDLLFQRLGRLHRHRRQRPEGFEQPRCTVLIPEQQRYELHKLIYGNGKAPNARVLWRTEQVVRQHPTVAFPDAYRPVIEKVYRQGAWTDEPAEITAEYENYWKAQEASRLTAKWISDIENAYDDTDDNFSLLTRDGEMSLNIVPFMQTSEGRFFLSENTLIDQLEEWRQAEEIMRNTVPAPRSWQNLGLPEPAADGLIWLPLEANGEDGWSYRSSKAALEYSIVQGLEMTRLQNSD